MLEVRFASPDAPTTWVPASMLGAPVGELRYSHAAAGGSLLAEWVQRLPDGFTHPLLEAGTLVMITLGGYPIWRGVLTEPDRVAWTFTANGVFRRAEAYFALTSTGAPTTNPNTAVYQATQTNAHQKPIPWVYPSSGGVFPTTATSTILDGTSTPVRLSALLGDLAQKAGKVWGIDPVTAEPYYRVVPSTPTVVIAPGTPGLPTAPEGQVTSLIAKRATATSGTPAQPSAWAISRSNSTAADAAANRWTSFEEWVDLTDRGVLADSDARTILNLMVDAGLSAPAYAGQLQLAPWQVMDLGGSPVDLRMLCAGQLGGVMPMVRQLGVMDTEGVLVPGQSVDWVIGKSEYDDTTGLLTLTPYLADAQTVPEVIKKLTPAGAQWVLDTPATY